eukprot:g16020.t1
MEAADFAGRLQLLEAQVGDLQRRLESVSREKVPEAAPDVQKRLQSLEESMNLQRSSNDERLKAPESDGFGRLGELGSGRPGLILRASTEHKDSDASAGAALVHHRRGHKAAVAAYREHLKELGQEGGAGIRSMSPAVVRGMTPVMSVPALRAGMPNSPSTASLRALSPETMVAMALQSPRGDIARGRSSEPMMRGPVRPDAPRPTLVNASRGPSDLATASTCGAGATWMRSQSVGRMATKDLDGASSSEAKGWLAKVPPLPEWPGSRPSSEVLVVKPRLPDEVEALFAEAAALVAARPRRNTRLQVLEEEMQRHGAARKIALAWKERALQRQQRAAGVVQKHFRGLHGRRHFQAEKRKQCACRLQRWWRKKRFYLAWFRTHMLRKCAVKLQSWHRGNKAREEVYNMLVQRQAASAVKLQSWLRGKQVRDEVKQQQRSARKIQAHWRWHRLWQAYLRYREREQQRQRAARQIQASARSFLSVQELQRRKQAAAKARGPPVTSDSAVPGVQTAPTVSNHNAEPPRSVLNGFCAHLCSPLVSLEGKVRARRTGVHPKGMGLGCVVFGDGPLPHFPEGRYFEVRIEEVAQDFPDGLNLGVALKLPMARPKEPYATCEEVPRSFCYGFDGMAHRCLPKNADLIDLIVNGILEVFSIDGLPDQDLFPLVELMGNTVAVSLRPGASPPAVRPRDPKMASAPTVQVNAAPEPPPSVPQVPTAEMSSKGAAPLTTLNPGAVQPSQVQPAAVQPAAVQPAAVQPTAVQPAAAQGRFSTRRSMAPAPKAAPEASSSGPAQAVMPPTETLPTSHSGAPRRSAAREGRFSSRRSMAKPAAAPVKATGAFYAPLLSKQMQLSKDGNSVRHKDETGQQLYGIAVGSSPLAPLPGGRYFEVRVDKVRKGMSDGLALGFTLVPPSELAGEELHEVSDTLPESWTAGYDGFYRSVNYADNDQTTLTWNPSSLQVNDRVGALLTRAGQFMILVNGKVVVRVSDDFPLADVEAFYPVVDLLGRVFQVTMTLDVVPPPDVTVGATFTGFDPKLTAHLDGTRLLCASNDAGGDALGGVVFGDGPLPCTGPDGEAYFEILMGCDVKDAWSIGYNGCAFSPDLEEELPVKWSPVNLQRGDCAGLLDLLLGDFCWSDHLGLDPRSHFWKGATVMMIRNIPARCQDRELTAIIQEADDETGELPVFRCFDERFAEHRHSARAGHRSHFWKGATVMMIRNIPARCQDRELTAIIQEATSEFRLQMPRRPGNGKCKGYVPRLQIGIRMDTCLNYCGTMGLGNLLLKEG